GVIDALGKRNVPHVSPGRRRSVDLSLPESRAVRTSRGLPSGPEITRNGTSETRETNFPKCLTIRGLDGAGGSYRRKKWGVLGQHALHSLFVRHEVRDSRPASAGRSAGLELDRPR